MIVIQIQIRFWDKFKLVSVLLTLIASAIDVAPASLIRLWDKIKLVDVLLTLIALAIYVAPASLIWLSYKFKLVSVVLKSCLWLSSNKKLIKLHGGQLDVTTNIYLKSCAYHADSAALVQNAAPSFMVLWRCTVLLVCHLKHVEVGGSTRNYPHTGHLS